jgi:aryl-alcohol dehydrogenase-like predicted oxidoreductase
MRRLERAGRDRSLLAQPGVTAPIIAASRMHHLDDAGGALDVKLTRDEIASWTSRIGGRQ